MFKRLACIACVVIVSASMFAQSILDPDDSVYSDIRSWQTQGIVGLLPQMRPYPANLIQDTLNKVIAEGSEQQSSRAKYQYERLFGRRPVIGAKAEAFAKNGTESNGKQLVAGPFLAGTVTPFDRASISFDIATLVSNRERKTLISPSYSASQYDMVDDLVKISSSLRGSFQGNANISYGTPGAYIMAGLNRSSWGDFIDDSVVLSSDAFHAGTVTAAINRERWNYALSMLSITASNNTGSGSYAQKYLILHSVTFQPIKALDVTVFETMVYGERFEPLYLIPVVPMMLSQGMTGFADDNLIMGLAFKVKPIAGLNWNTCAYVDDANLNELVKLDLDTQVKFAAQTGFVWTPDSPSVSTVELNYTAVMPYMYTHWSKVSEYGDRASDTNYQNYTNYGANLGSQLQPNSDRIKISTTLRPSDNVKVDIGGEFIRHANINESLPDDIALKYMTSTNLLTDGSVYDYAEEKVTGSFAWAKQHFLFLCQDTKEYTVKGSLSATIELPRNAWGQIALNAGYTGEYIINSGVNTSIYSSNTTADSAAVAAAKSAWKANLKNILNNYISLGMKYSW